MITIENITYSVVNGQREFIIDIFGNSANTSAVIGLPRGKWDYSTVVNTLIRSKYSQDSVEALVNNHLLAMSEWQDKIFAGENPGRFEDPEYNELQQWRATSKQLATQIIEEINKIN